MLNLESFIVLNAVYALSCLWATSRRDGACPVSTKKSLIDLNKLLPNQKIDRHLLIVATVFFILVMAPRLGLLKGHFPIGDDFRQIPKVVSIAISPNEPLFPYFPITRLTIYYFNNVAPGLLVRLTDNLLKAHQAWFLHVAICTAVMLC